ncbi:MAG: type 2 isopentenyl-diphosphate Delta-isomerase [Hyphomicrobiales bacterium]
MSDIEQRKRDHIKIVLSGAARHSASAGFDGIAFEHNALPELSFNDIDLSTRFLGKTLKLPYLASSMTGGPADSDRINLALAEAAEQCGFAMGVGSQRIALAGGKSHGLDRRLRDHAPTIPIYANLGAVQLVNGMGIDHARRAVEEIGADALILHLNPIQEVLQKDGDYDWRGVTKAIADLVEKFSAPVIVKEVGFGISVDVARRLLECGVSAIDVAGAGGTSWAAVEGRRAPDQTTHDLGELFRDWGIPTVESLASLRGRFPDLPLIASGGVRHGLEAAKAIRLGADLVGQAAALLAPAMQGTEAVIAHVEFFARALRLACFATGSKDLRTLRKAALR